MHPTPSALPTRPALVRPRARIARRTLAASLLGLTLLAGCGGGVSIGIGFDLTPSDDPPQVSLATSRDSAFEGDRIDLAARASDDYRVSRIEVWQSNNNTVTQLVESRTAAVDVVTAMPYAPTGVVYYMARAVDDNGQVSSTAWKAVTLR